MCEFALYCLRYARPVSFPVLASLALFVATNCRAEPVTGEDRSMELFSTTVVEHKINGEFKVRGWIVNPGLYVGQAKIGGEWGLGLLVDRGNYAYGLNHRQLSFTMRF